MCLRGEKAQDVRILDVIAQAAVFFLSGVCGREGGAGVLISVVGGCGSVVFAPQEACFIFALLLRFLMAVCSGLCIGYCLKKKDYICTVLCVVFAVLILIFLSADAARQAALCA